MPRETTFLEYHDWHNCPRGFLIRRWLWFHFVRPILWRLDPETAGHVALFTLQLYGFGDDFLTRHLRRPLRYWILIMQRDLARRAALKEG